METDQWPQFSPEATRQVAASMAEETRFLNHATGHHASEALEYPADMDSVVQSLTTMAQRLPQLLEQIPGWLHEQHAEGRLAVTYGSYKNDPGSAAGMVEIWLDDARVAAGKLYEALDHARQITATISAASSAEDDDA